MLTILVISSQTQTLTAQTIQWRYNDPVMTQINPLWEVLITNESFNLAEYAKDYAAGRGGDRSTAKVFLAANDAYGWRMKYYVKAKKTWYTVGFDMLDVARWHGQRKYGRKMKNYGVYFTNKNSPYTWKGAYIVSIW